MIKEPSQNIAEIINDYDGINATEFPLKLPPGFKISIFADNVPKARVMAWDNGGNMLVSQTSLGKITHLRLENNEVVEQTTFLEGLNKPHGMVFSCDVEQNCKIYVAEEHQIFRADYDSVGVSISNKEVIAKLPTEGGGHYTRTLGIGPDNRLYVSSGSSCNVCVEGDPMRAAIYSMELDGSDQKLYASGLRNTVFFHWQYVNGDLWGVDMGRDLIGDDIPPDEANIIKEGQNYGWPFYYGKSVRDLDFQPTSKDAPAEKEVIDSHIDFQAHSAPLGFDFVDEEGWPEEYWYDMLVAFHGSWNRSVPTGYKIYRIKLDEKGNYLGEEDFITGWLLDSGEALGRPVDIMIQPGGQIYITDDKAGVIYKVTYSPENTTLVESEDRLEDYQGMLELGLIEISSSLENLSSPVKVTGNAPGPMFFEGSFMIIIKDANGKTLGNGFAIAQTDWMTSDNVTFKAEISLEAPTTDTGEIIFQGENPSGLPENDIEITLPITFS